jgi:hypothetical protein
MEAWKEGRGGTPGESLRSSLAIVGIQYLDLLDDAVDVNAQGR